MYTTTTRYKYHIKIFHHCTITSKICIILIYSTKTKVAASITYFDLSHFGRVCLTLYVLRISPIIFGIFVQPLFLALSRLKHQQLNGIFYSNTILFSPIPLFWEWMSALLSEMACFTHTRNLLRGKVRESDYDSFRLHVLKFLEIDVADSFVPQI